MTRRIALRQCWPLLLLGLSGALVALCRPAVAGVAGAAPSSAETVLAGGCYWGVESVFRHVRGVESAISGYAIPATAAGGERAEPVEAVRITYDSSQLSYRQLLDVFFAVVHDPTQSNRQGPDVGREYRSVVFVDGDLQRSVVRAYIDSLSTARVFPGRIVTAIATLQSFQAVDNSQQNYAARHPSDPYIVINDVPKVEALRRKLPRLYRD